MRGGAWAIVALLLVSCGFLSADRAAVRTSSGKVRKAKAAVPGQAKLDAFRGKSRSGMSAKKKKGPPPRPVRKKWPIVRT